MVHMAKAIVIYYTRTGTTRKFAEALANAFGASVVEIKDKKKRLGFFNWFRSGRDAYREFLTDIEPKTVDISGMDLVLFGTPVWAGKSSPAINTIISNLDLSGKKVVNFTTSGGENNDKAFALMDKHATAKGGSVIGHTMVRARQIERAKEIAENFAKTITT